MKHLKLLFLALFLVFASKGFSQWTYCPGSLQMSGLGPYPYVSVLDQNNVWVCGGTGGAPKVYKSTNGGTNFINVTGSLTGPEFFAIWVVDANTALVGDGGAVGGTGGNAKIWRTTDGGTSWNTVLTTGGSLGFWNGIAGAPNNRSFVYAQSDQPAAGGQFIAISTNGGANWTTSQTTVGGTTGAAGSVFVASPTYFGHGISGFSRVCFTTNGGTSFTQGALTVAGGTTPFTSGFAMNDGGSIILGATSASLPSINRSTTLGSSWTTQGVGGTISAVAIIKWVPTTTVFYLTGQTGTNAIRRSLDGGLTWTTMTIATLTGWVGMDLVFQGGTVYAYAIAGSDGSVIKLIDNLTGIDPGNTTIPNEFALQQNYPNPFNPSTTIKYSVPTAGLVTLKIYNSLGAEVKTVINSDLAVGNYVETVDMSSFSSGTYFYTLSAGNFKETKKMMLVK